MKRLAVALLVAAGCNGGAPCALEPRLDAQACLALSQMALPSALPPSPTNAHADDADAALLGFKIYYDARFSGPHTVRCATCHAPETHFGDSHPVAQGLALGPRNAPSTLGVAWRSSGFMWDGRADVLWAPPIGAMENPLEMGFSRLEIAHTIGRYYSELYQKTFGSLPDLNRFPEKGKPGDPAYDQLSTEDRDAIDRVAANIGKSLEAYLRKLATGPSAFDRYLAGDASALDAQQRSGMTVFAQAGCLSCHGGPLLADGRFHNLGVPAAEGAEPDPGRAPAIALERAQQFSPENPLSDAPHALAVGDATEADLGAFRTPSLRNVALTFPYMHNGRFATLAEAVDFHLQGGGRDAGGFVGAVDPQLVAHALSADERAALLAFLSSLTGAYPAPPWNDWPDRP